MASQSHIQVQHPPKSAVLLPHLRVVCSIHNFGLHGSEKKIRSTRQLHSVSPLRLKGIEEGQKELEPPGEAFHADAAPRGLVNVSPWFMGVHTILVGARVCSKVGEFYENRLLATNQLKSRKQQNGSTTRIPVLRVSERTLLKVWFCKPNLGGDFSFLPFSNKTRKTPRYGQKGIAVLKELILAHQAALADVFFLLGQGIWYKLLLKINPSQWESDS